jgi:hypothetical protein
VLAHVSVGKSTSPSNTRIACFGTSFYCHPWHPNTRIRLLFLRKKFLQWPRIPDHGNQRTPLGTKFGLSTIVCYCEICRFGALPRVNPVFEYVCHIFSWKFIAMLYYLLVTGLSLRIGRPCISDWVRYIFQLLLNSFMLCFLHFLHSINQFMDSCSSPPTRSVFITNPFPSSKSKAIRSHQLSNGTAPAIQRRLLPLEIRSIPSRLHNIHHPLLHRYHSTLLAYL